MRILSIYCESYGCQMNASDTEVISGLMEQRGHRIVTAPEEADCIVVNTCSVRDHAEQRAIGRLFDLSRHRKAFIAVCGCMAQRLGTSLFDLVPAVRIVAGTDSYLLLPDAIEDAAETGNRSAFLDMDDATTYELPPQAFRGPISRFVSITRGCENYCSYCIVPSVRGKVRSRDAGSLVREIASLVEHGAREVTLLGQSVIAYRSNGVDFLALAQRVLDETGIARLRFLTSHPRDVTSALFELMARDKRLCAHIHLPVQSGNNRILSAMNRGYTRERYLDSLSAARSIVPDLAITSDVIVGYPTEGEEEFRETLDLVREARFDSAFTFRYSPRNGTAASALADDVPPEIKAERLHRLNALVQEMRGEVLRAQLGSRAEILLDGMVQKGENRLWKGRTPHFRNVLVSGASLKEGDIVAVVLKHLINFTFEGEVIQTR